MDQLMWSSVLERWPENVSFADFCTAAGIEGDLYFMDDEIEDAGLFEEYEDDPIGVVSKLDVPRKRNGKSLHGFFDGPDGLVAVYLNVEAETK